MTETPQTPDPAEALASVAALAAEADRLTEQRILTVDALQQAAETAVRAGVPAEEVKRQAGEWWEPPK